MKLTRIQAERYECRLAPYRVVIRKGRRGRWVCRLYLTNDSWYGMKTQKTLQTAKETVVREWLVLVRNGIIELLNKDGGWRAEGPEILESVRRGDPLGPAVFRDWLEDNGYPGLIRDRIVLPGRRAKITWPEGWDTVEATTP